MISSGIRKLWCTVDYHAWNALKTGCVYQYLLIITVALWMLNVQVFMQGHITKKDFQLSVLWFILRCPGHNDLLVDVAENPPFYLFIFIDQERLRNASPMKIDALWNSRSYIRPPQSLLFNIYYFCFSPNCLVLLKELHQTQASWDHREVETSSSWCLMIWLFLWVRI